MNKSRWLLVLEAAVACTAAGYLLYIYPWAELLRPTVTAGGDMASHYYPTWIMHKELLPNWQITGWTMGNYCGFPIFHFYSTFPFFLIAALGYLLPMQEVFKLVTLLGPTTLPLAAAYLFRSLGYGPGASIIAAGAVLPVLFQQGNSMWGGNISSVLAGEFCHSIGISLSLVFLGMLHRTVKGRGSWIACGILLALTGLSHTFAFMAAMWSALFYVWPRRDVVKYGRYAAPVFLLAFLLLCFWGLPLAPRVKFTTEFNPVWRITDWKTVVPELLWPASVLALANLFLLIPRPRSLSDFPVARVLLGLLGAVAAGAAYYGVSNGALTLQSLACVSILASALLLLWAGVPGRAFSIDRHGLILFTLFGSVFLYAVVPDIGFPDIRFVPMGQIFSGFLAADLLVWAGSRFKYRILYATVILAATIAWTNAHIGYVPSWLKWNYSGYEGKVTWNLFKSINDEVRGDVNSPRVVFEHSQQHNKFGSSRAFENLPFFAGRSTLEGVFHQVSLNSPFVFYIQSEVSEKTSGPFSQYTYMRLNPEAALPHLRLYNVDTIIAVSAKAKEAYEADPNFERTFSSGGYEVYKIVGQPTGYVVPAANEPVLYEGKDYKLAFYRWFKHPELLDIPLVPEALIGESESRSFGLRTDTPRRVPRNPYEGECQVTAHLEQERISFDTTCPNRPHIVKVSYFPRWKSVDGSPVYPVAPGFMLVYPSQTHFELYYGRTALDWFALSMTVIGLLWGLACAASPRLSAASVDGLARILAPLWTAMAARRRLLSALLIVVCLLVAFASRYGLKKPADILHEQAQAAYRQRDFARAVELLERWTADDKDTFKQATALYQLGVSQSELDHHAAAVQVLERLLFDFPNVNYGAGTLFHLAKNYAALNMRDRAAQKAAELQRDYGDTGWLTRLKKENPELFTTGQDEAEAEDNPTTEAKPDAESGP